MADLAPVGLAWYDKHYQHNVGFASFLLPGLRRSMSELRQDPISGQWVIMAPERAGRPDDFVGEGDARPQGECPFCAGHEYLTSTPLLEWPAHSVQHVPWQIRVLPNKYPAVSANVGQAFLPADSPTPAFGQHEVVVESPQHLLSVTQLEPRQFAEVVRVYRDRVRTLKEDHRLRCALVFKNMGLAGGATLEHVHSQIVALPTVPDRLRAELDGAAQWHDRHGTCPYCAMIEREQAAGVRLVAETESLVAISPHAARMPYETWVLPRQHASHFEQLSDTGATELAGLLQRVLKAIEAVCGSGRHSKGAYNYFIHSAPFDTPPCDHYHWHVEIIPRMTRLAGFEWGTGWHINPVTPEAATQRLRKLLGPAD